MNGIVQQLFRVVNKSQAHYLFGFTYKKIREAEKSNDGLLGSWRGINIYLNKKLRFKKVKIRLKM